MKHIPKIKCGSCGRSQGSNICKRCRKKIQSMIDSNIEPSEIAKIMIPEYQSTLEEFC